MKIQGTIFSILVLMILAGCGQKGDLYKTEDAPPPSMEKTAS